MALRVGIKSGIRAGIKSGINNFGDTVAAWTVDGASGKAAPANAGEWAAFIAANALAITAPDEVFNCQEGSGNLVGSIAGTVLVPNATPLYGVATAGWSRLGVGFNGTSSQRFYDSAFVDTSANSVMLLLYVGFTGAPAASSYIANMGALDNLSITAGSAGQQTFRYRQGANILQMAGTYTNPTVYPVCVNHNITATTARLYSDSEKISPTYGATAVADDFSLGSIGGTSFTGTILYAAAWTGSNAEHSDANIKAAEQALGWTIGWT